MLCLRWLKPVSTLEKNVRIRRIGTTTLYDLTVDTDTDTSLRDQLVRTRIPNNVERGGQTASTSFNIRGNKRNVEKFERFSLLSSFNIDSISIQHVSTRLKGGGGGGENGCNFVVRHNLVDVEGNVEARSGFLAWSQRSFFGVLSHVHVINPILTKLVLSRWLDIGLVRFLRVYGPLPRLDP